jgi:hypothetical protein
MTRKQRRLTMIGGSLAVLAVAAALVLNAMRDSIVFFSTPAMVAEKTYMPRDVADALKKQGHWRDEYGAKSDAKPDYSAKSAMTQGASRAEPSAPQAEPSAPQAEPSAPQADRTAPQANSGALQ